MLHSRTQQWASQVHDFDYSKSNHIPLAISPADKHIDTLGTPLLWDYCIRYLRSTCYLVQFYQEHLAKLRISMLHFVIEMPEPDSSWDSRKYTFLYIFWNGALFHLHFSYFDTHWSTYFRVCQNKEHNFSPIQVFQALTRHSLNTTLSAGVRMAVKQEAEDLYNLGTNCYRTLPTDPVLQLS